VEFVSIAVYHDKMYRSPHDSRCLAPYMPLRASENLPWLSPCFPSFCQGDVFAQAVGMSA
jgi:hypothetical protein